MAAALTTIRLLKETDGIERMRVSGQRLQDGLRAQAERHGFAVSVTGPPQMPLLLFADDPEYAKSLAWSGACAHHGVYLHPVHNWFLSAAHDEATIDEALERTDAAFAELHERLANGTSRVSR
jgi:glutamate-1-semialdehyde 2,1-aminomutase